MHRWRRDGWRQDSSVFANSSSLRLLRLLRLSRVARCLGSWCRFLLGGVWCLDHLGVDIDISKCKSVKVIEIYYVYLIILLLINIITNTCIVVYWGETGYVTFCRCIIWHEKTRIHSQICGGLYPVTLYLYTVYPMSSSTIEFMDEILQNVDMPNMSPWMSRCCNFQPIGFSWISSRQPSWHI